MRAIHLSVLAVSIAAGPAMAQQSDSQAAEDQERAEISRLAKAALDGYRDLDRTFAFIGEVGDRGDSLSIDRAQGDPLARFFLKETEITTDSLGTFLARVESYLNAMAALSLTLDKTKLGMPGSGFHNLTITPELFVKARAAMVEQVKETDWDGALRAIPASGSLSLETEAGRRIANDMARVFATQWTPDGRHAYAHVSDSLDSLAYWHIRVIARRKDEKKVEDVEKMVERLKALK